MSGEKLKDLGTDGFFAGLIVALLIQLAGILLYAEAHWVIALSCTPFILVPLVLMMVGWYRTRKGR